MKWQTASFIAVLFICHATLLFGQDKGLFDRGFPQITQYTPQTYKAHSQTWGIIQSQNGKMYFGNGDGILEFDGVSWNLIQTTTRNMVRRFVMDRNGVIFCYGTGDFGYLKADSLGKTSFHSLLTQLRGDIRDNISIRDMISENGKVYFLSKSVVFVWDTNTAQMTFIDSDTELKSLLLYKKDVYVHRNGRSYIIRNGTFIESTLQIESNVSSILEPIQTNQDGRDYFVTSEGIFSIKNDRVTKRSRGIDNVFKNGFFNEFMILTDNRIVVSTGMGIYLLDPEGDVLLNIRQEDGLKSSRIHSVLVDKDQAVWITSDQGIARLSFNIPFRYFDIRNGLPGIINDILKVDETLYVTTHDGIFRNGETGFEPLFSPNPESFKMLKIKNDLMVVTSKGIFVQNLKSGESKKILPHHGYKIFQSRINPETIYVCANTGLHSFQWSAGRVTGQRSFTNSIGDFIRFIEEDENCNLWLGSTNDPLYKFDIYSEGTLENPKVTKYTHENGLPVSEIKINRIDGQYLFSSLDGVFQFDGISSFSRHPDFMNDNSMIPYILDSKYQNGVYLLFGDTPFMKLVSYKFSDNGFVPLEKPELSLFESSGLWMAFEDDDNIIWLGTTDGLIAYDPAGYQQPSGRKNTFISSVWVNGDSLITANISGKAGLKIQIPMQNNALKFDYALPAYDLAANTTYQVMLEGLDTGWSPWSVATTKEYTHLSFGNYSFKVRGKDAIGNVGRVTQFDFTILTPWYLSIWFFGGSVITVVAFIVFIVRYYSRLKLKSRVRELETETRIQRERERISRNLHDDVGAQLTSIISGIKSAESIESINKNVQVKKMLLSLKEDAEESISNLRDTIWTLNKEAISLEDFIDHIESYGRSLFKYGDAVNFTIECDRNCSIAIKPMVAFNLKKIIQESLHNILKHTQASNVSITIDPLPGENKIKINIEDNGIGFNVEKAIKSENHYGLQNMKKRTSDINGIINIYSKTNIGTSIKLEVPVQ